jgi:hypothetical protein
MKTHIIRILIAVRRLSGSAPRAARRACSAFAEFNREQMWYNERRLARTVYMKPPGTAPDTYDEFLLCTRGPLRHEPSARARLDGHPVH